MNEEKNLLQTIEGTLGAIVSNVSGEEKQISPEGWSYILEAVKKQLPQTALVEFNKENISNILDISSMTLKEAQAYLLNNQEKFEKMMQLAFTPQDYIKSECKPFSDIDKDNIDKVAAFYCPDCLSPLNIKPEALKLFIAGENAAPIIRYCDNCGQSILFNSIEKEN